MTGDTVACRQYHASNMPPAVHCAHAGPYATPGHCGTDADRCKSFCALANALCETFATPPYGADGGTCLADCAGYQFLTDAGTGSESPPAPSSGDTFNCRQYHLQAAYKNNGGGKTPHCGHIGKTSPTCQ